MENIYEFKSLISAINALLRSKKLNYKTISDLTRIHPSYFSRAMKGQAFFSQTQIFLIAEKLSLTDEEKKYLILLWSFQQSERTPEKDFFHQQIKDIQNKKLKVSERIQSQIISELDAKIKYEKYYSEAVTSLIHALLTIPTYRNNLNLLAEKVFISKDKLELELKKLKELELIHFKDGKIQKVIDNIHLPEDSVLSIANHINWRLRAIQYLQNRQKQTDDYHLSVVFTATPETKEQLKKIIQDFVVEAQKKVGDCRSPTDVFHLMLDLY